MVEDELDLWQQPKLLRCAYWICLVCGNKLYGAGNISKLDSRQQLKPLCCHYWQLLAALTSSLTVLQQGIYCQSQVQRNSVQFFLYSFNSLQNLFVIAERFLTVLFSLAVSSY